MSTNKVLLAYVIFILTFSFIPSFIDNNDVVVKADEHDWLDFWSKLKKHTKLEFEWSTDQNIWYDCRDELSIYYVDLPEEDRKKFGLDFVAPETAYYRIKLTILYPLVANISINKHDHFIKAYLGNYTIKLNYSDIAALPVNLYHSGDGPYYTFYIYSKNIVPQGYHMDLDPEYIITRSDTGIYPGFPYDALHWQNSRRLCRIANGTFYMIFCNGTYPNNEWIDLCRSFDGGYTWYYWRKVDNASGINGPFCPNIVPDSHSNLHIAWQGLSAGYNISYCMYNTSGDSWKYVHGYLLAPKPSFGFVCYQPTLDIDNQNRIYVAYYNTGGAPDYRALYVVSDDLGTTWSEPRNISTGQGYKQSMGMWAFFDNRDGVYVWTGQHVGTGGTYAIRMRKYFYSNDTWSTEIINVSAPIGVATDQYFAAVAADNYDNVHISWFDVNNIDVYYCMYNYSNSSFTGVEKIDDGATPSLSIDNNDIVYIAYMNTHAGASTFYGLYPKYVFGRPGDWCTPIKAMNNSNGGSVTINDPCLLYSRYPYLQDGSNLPMNRPAQGCMFIYLNDTNPVNKIILKTENLTFYSTFGGFTIQPQVVNTTRATLRSRLTSSNPATLAGFYVSADGEPSRYDHDFNVTAGTDYTYPGKPNIYYNITGLTSGTYYYIKAWFDNGTSGFRMANATYMLTKPENVTAITQTSNSGSKISLQWVNPIIPGGTLRAVCRYSTTSYPGTPAAGSAGFNVSASSGALGTGTITGLAPGTDYYCSIFAYLTASGSPTLSGWSTGFGGIVANTSGGQYNITIRFENTSYTNPFNYLNNRLGWHTLIVQYDNRTEYNYFNFTRAGANPTGHLFTESPGNFNWTSKGYILLNLSQTPLWFEFRWNDTYNRTEDFACRRTQVVTENKNYTFYVITDKLVYGKSTSYKNDSIIPYTYQFVDLTSVLTDLSGLDVYFMIFTYNLTGGQMVIHSQYWDTYQQIYPWLQHGQKYFIGVYSSALVFPNFGIAPADDELVPVVIVSVENITQWLNPQESYFVNTNKMPGNTGIYVFYYDWSFTLTTSHVKFFGLRNHTFCNSSSSNATTTNFSYTGASHLHGYYWILWLNSTHSSLTVNITGFIYGNITNVTSWERLNETLSAILGDTPFRSTDDPTVFVTWIALGIFFLSLFALASFPSKNIEVGGVLVGIIYIGCGIFISGSTLALVPFGAFLIIMSVIYGYKGVDEA